MAGLSKETGALTPWVTLGPSRNSAWLKRTTATAPITPAANPIAARWLTVKALFIVFKSFSIVLTSLRCLSVPSSSMLISWDMFVVFIPASVVVVALSLSFFYSNETVFISETAVAHTRRSEIKKQNGQPTVQKKDWPSEFEGKRSSEKRDFGSKKPTGRNSERKKLRRPY